MLKIYLNSVADDSTPVEVVWVCTEKLDELWKINSHTYISEWKGEPKIKWFHPTSNKECLLIPELYFDINPPHAITFVNGRHRTRWLIQKGCTKIPVGIQASQIELARRIGLLLKVATEGDLIQFS